MAERGLLTYDATPMDGHVGRRRVAAHAAMTWRAQTPDTWRSDRGATSQTRRTSRPSIAQEKRTAAVDDDDDGGGTRRGGRENMP